jgi:hypothetical protein
MLRRQLEVSLFSVPNQDVIEPETNLMWFYIAIGGNTYVPCNLLAQVIKFTVMDGEQASKGPTAGSGDPCRVFMLE